LGGKVVVVNRKARRLYHVEERFEAGLVLLGSEVKSLREGGTSIQEGYVEIKDGEFYLVGVNIPPYRCGGYANHEPLRDRKLLLNSHEIKKLRGKISQKGYTAIPLKLYFKSSWAKVEIGIARGKSKVDRREELKKRYEREDLNRALKRSFKGERHEKD